MGRTTIKKDGEWYVATDCSTRVASQGKTKEEARKNLREALELYYHDEEEKNKTSFNRQMAEIQGEVHRILSTTGKLDQIRNDKDYRGEPQVIRRLFEIIKCDPKNTKCMAEIQKAESELFDFLEGNENAPTEEEILAYWDRFLQAYIDESPGEPKSQKMGVREVLSKYANPELASKEQGAWERATVKKYGKGGKNMDINNMDIEKATKHAFELVADTSLDNLMYAGEDFAGLYVGLESKYKMDSTDFFNIFAHAYQLGFLYGRKAEKEGWEPRPLEDDDKKS